MLPKAPFIPTAHIERAMEQELARSGLFPKNIDKPVIDIEAFIEVHLKVPLDQFAELESDVLGVTHFTPGGKPRVEINRDLTQAADDSNEPWLRGRWRITMAHEAAHVILHAGEIEASAQQFTLFENDSQQEAKMQRCLKRDLHEIGNRADPREIQANYAMAALLMPRELFSHHASVILPMIGTYDLSSRSYWEAIAELGQVFQVSKEAVRIRIEKLGLGAIIGQGQMKL